jgi:myo-inositol 2-dehydrogenase/D-chiro-inositol 1-dehydrogenase
MVQICQFGAGRIGHIHAANVAAHPTAELRYVVDINNDAAASLAAEHGAAVADAEQALADAAIDAVIIASSTDTHADLIEASARAGKAIFCEKPVDLSLERVDRCLAEADRRGVPLMMGFNRRFDPSFAALHQALREGRIGRVELVQITSRDPAPPPIEYVKVSGGLFRDMMIHDFDMARWLLGEEPVEVFAGASCLVDPEIGAAGDVDTAAVTLKTAGGALAVITNSRRAVYGYDQRIEVLGSEGMLRAGNRRPTTLEISTTEAVSRDTPLYFFLERYAEAYRAELDHFIECLAQGRTPAVGAGDGRMALVLAEAAVESWQSGAPARVNV